MKTTLEIRSQLKTKKPNFLRQNAHKLKKLDKVWRAPKGMHSKLRKKFRGKQKQPSIGYSSPKDVRGTHPSGLIPILINNLGELKNITKEQGLILSSTLGKKKRVELLTKIKEQELTVLNIKNIDSYLKNIETEMKKKQEEKKKKKDIKKKIKQEAEKKKEKPKKEETIEEKEEKEKKQKKEVLEGKK